MFAKRLKLFRKEKKLSQAALAVELGVTQQAVAKWEKEGATPSPQMLVQIAQVLSVSTDALVGHGALLPKQAVPYDGQEVLLPVLGVVRAGYGRFALEEDCGQEYARVKNPDAYFYLRIQGDSMEPRIHDGDLALIRKQKTLYSGELGVVVFGEGEATLKRYIVCDDGVRLEAFNPLYPVQIIRGSELEQLHIIGKVVETVAKW